MIRFTEPTLWVWLLLFLAGSAATISAQPMSQYGVGLVSQPAWLQAQYYLRITNAFGQGSNIFLTYRSNQVFINANTNFATNLITMSMSSNMAWIINTGFFGSSTTFSIAMSNGAVQAAISMDNGILQAATNYADSKDRLGLQSATNYANTILQSSTNYTDSKANGVLQSATNYSHGILQSSTNYANSILQSSTNYANTILQSATNYADSKDALVLQASTNYANSLLSVRSLWYLRADWTNNLTTNGYIISPLFDSLATTTAISHPAGDNNYLFSFTTTNQVFGFIEDGSVTVDFDALRGAGSLSIKNEFYLITNNVEYYEFASSSPIALTTTRTHYRSVVILTTNAPLEPNAQIRVKIKCESQIASPTMSIFTGSNAVSVVEIPTPSATINTSSGQPASENLTNWSLYSTNVILETASGVLQSSTNYTDTKSSGVLQAATNYSHGILQSATNYTDTKANGILQSATNYSDTKDALILQSATNYTDSLVTNTLVTTSGITNFLVNLDYREQFISATNTLHFDGTTNRPGATQVKNISFVVKNATASNNTLYFNGSWVWIETSYSTSATVTNGKTGILALKCYGPNETDVIAAFAIQP